MKDFVKEHSYIFLGMVCIIVMGILFVMRMGVFGEQTNRVSLGEVLTLNTDESRLGLELDSCIYSNPMGINENPTEVFYVVHILGAVHNPGVFTLPADARIIHAIEKAGGYTADADLRNINLAAPLRDAMQIIVPVVGEIITPIEEEPTSIESTPHTTALNDNGFICINTASSTLLQTLPNIGPARAQAIIDFRESHGAFTRVEDLLNITGIGHAIVEALRPLIIVR